MKLTVKDGLTILAFLGLGSWGAWEKTHDTYIEEKHNEKLQKKLIQEVIDGDVLNEQKKFNLAVLKRLDTIDINYKYIGVLFDITKDNNSHIQKLENFNKPYGYRY